MAVHEPAEGYLFGNGTGEIYGKPFEAGAHGLWPGRPEYRSAYVLWRRGVKPKDLGEIDMLSIAGRFAKLLGWKFP